MLYDKGIVEGYPDGFYRPATWVSRDQMAVYMARAVADPVGEEGLEGYTPPAKPSFLDADAEHWAYKHIEYCAENSIVAGYADGFYRPSKLVTRDQMAVYVARAFGLM
jgi:competence protein ComEC